MADLRYPLTTGYDGEGLIDESELLSSLFEKVVPLNNFPFFLCAMSRVYNQ